MKTKLFRSVSHEEMESLINTWVDEESINLSRIYSCEMTQSSDPDGNTILTILFIMKK